MQEYNDRNSKKIQCYAQLEKLNNVGISFWDMNCESVIQKLFVIEKNATAIWKAFEQFYGRGFFNACIEQEYGITPETHNQLVEKFDQKVKEF